MKKNRTLRGFLLSTSLATFICVPLTSHEAYAQNSDYVAKYDPAAAYSEYQRKGYGNTFEPRVIPRSQVTESINQYPTVPVQNIYVENSYSDSLNSPEASRFNRKPLKPRAEINFRPGTERSIGMIELWAPLVQDPQEGSVIYGDVRFMDDNQSNNEFNAGVGYRKIVTDVPVLGDGVAGVHGWYDRRFTKRDSKFNQITLGGEWKGNSFDTNVNGYVAISDAETHFDANPNTNNTGFVGNQVVVNTSQTIIEEPLDGVDLELGYRIPAFERDIDAIRVYGGGYHFWGDDVEDVTGFRTRVQADITSDISVGARYQRDDVRGSQSFADITFRFPWGSKKKFQQDGLYARLDESPERDIDIVSNEAVTDDGVNKLLVDATTGNAVQVYHVDNTAVGGGDGSVENPFNTLVAAQVVAGSGDVIYVNHGDGTSTGQNAGITLNNDRQVLAGSGENFTFDSSRFASSNGNSIANTVIEEAGLAPVITNVGGDGITLRGAGTLVSGITVDATAGNGIALRNSADTDIRNVTVTNATANGIDVATTITGGRITIENSTISDNAGNGVDVAHAGTTSHTLILSDNTVNNNVSNGIFIRTDDDVNLDINASGNTVTNTNAGDTAGSDAGRGLWLVAADDSDVVVDIDDNVFDQNRGESIELEARFSTGSTINGSVTNNMLTNALASATHSVNNTHIFLETHANGKIGSESNRFIVTGNTAADASEEGIVMKSVGAGGETYVYSSQNTTYGNDDGQEVRTQGGGFADTIFEYNVSRNNRETGIQVDTVTDTGTTVAIVRNNEIYDNQQQGIQISSNANGTAGTVANPIIVENNTITGNDLRGVIVTSFGGTGEVNAIIRNNEINNNDFHGINVTTNDTNTANITFDSNNINNSGDRGAFILNRGDAVMDITLSNNAFDTAVTQGVYVLGENNSTATINVNGNTISNVVGDGIDMTADDNATFSGGIASNTIMLNTDAGVNLTVRGTDDGDADALAGQIGTSGTAFSLTGNTIINNTNEGVTISSRDDEGAGFFSVSGNTISGNGAQGIEVDEFDSQTGVNNLDIDFGGGSFASIGRNSILNNAGVNLDYNADVATTISAEENWWGQDVDPTTFDEASDSDGLNEFVGINATIDSAPRLNSAP